MCNPNSSALAYRRQRAASLANNPQLESVVTSKSNGLLPESFTASLMLRKSDFRNYNVSEDVATENSGFSASPSYCSQIPRKENLQTEELYPIPAAPSSLYYGSYPPPVDTTPVDSAAPTKKPKRRRKPQKPGKTAKQNDRHFVIHNYHDHADDVDDDDVEQSGERRRGGVSVSFPQKMHSVLGEVERDGLAHVIAWQHHGRCFVIHKPKEFTEHVMPHYFRQTKLTSFQRQLNLYGFNRITRGPDAGGYYHELFLRGKEFLCKHMVRTKVKGTRFKAASSPEEEPDFSKMPPVIVTPASSVCDHSEIGSTPGGGYEYQNASSYQPRIGNPERYQQYQVPACTSPPRRPAAAGEKAQVPEISPVGYPGSRILPAAGPILPFTSFDAYESSPRAVAAVPSSLGMSHDQGVMDQAVDELFLGEGGAPPPEVNESVMDFVTCWDPSSYGPDAALENDTQLGNLLDRLLWDEI